MRKLTFQEIKKLKPNAKVFIKTINTSYFYEGFITIKENDQFLFFDIPCTNSQPSFCIDWNNYNENYFEDVIHFYKYFKKSKYQYINA